MKHFVTLPYLLSMYSTSSGRGFLPLVTAVHEISPTCSCMRDPGEEECTIYTSVHYTDMIRCHMLCQPIRILCSLLFQTNFSFLHVKSCPEVNVSSVFKMAYVTKLKFHITRETFIYRLQSQPAVFLKEILAAMQIGFRQNEWTKYHVKA